MFIVRRQLGGILAAGTRRSLFNAELVISRKESYVDYTTPEYQKQ